MNADKLIEDIKDVIYSMQWEAENDVDEDISDEYIKGYVNGLSHAIDIINDKLAEYKILNKGE